MWISRRAVFIIIITIIVAVSAIATLILTHKSRVIADEYIPPQEALGVRIDVSVKGGELVNHPIHGEIVAIDSEKDRVRIVVTLTNLGDKLKVYRGSFSYTYHLIDSDGVYRMNLDANVLLDPNKPINIEPGKSFTFETTTEPAFIHVNPLATESAETIAEMMSKGPLPPSIPAPPGVYTIRIESYAVADYDVVEEVGKIIEERRKEGLNDDLIYKDLPATIHRIAAETKILVISR